MDAFDTRDETWIAQALAVLDHFSEDEVRQVLARTTLHERLRSDYAALRAGLADQSGERPLIVRRRAAQHVLLAAGIFTQAPMKPVLYSWDWKEQPPMADIAVTVARTSGERRPVVMRPVSLGTDAYACVIADRAVTDDEALAIWRGENQ
jgi:hypothetical protein